ncbi:NACHT domain-containing protein [Microbacterium sp. HA-8]|uniref:NACHT domain-containing protein n=1 Tax=unclassified Microbacterium TaxID=2609290 RepID=UPI000C2CB00F|nr:NACHT domain-containing protein [Microbacterium sp. BR1]
MTITVATQKVLWGTSHNVCAYTLCVQPLTIDAGDGDGSVVVGEQAHIRSGRPRGPRHDPLYEDVDGPDNLILLCPTHHTLIDSDDGRHFTVAQLEQMKAQHVRQQDKRAKFSPAIRAYMADRYGAEDFVQFQQAELKARVDAMFVDVPLGCRADSRAAALVGEISRAHPGDPLPADSRRSLLVAGAAQMLLHPEWKENAVLVGGPGQGKSTILQYLAQYYRARRLDKSTYDAQDVSLVRSTGLARIPLRLDLRRYAQWRRIQRERAVQEGKEASEARTDLERYLLGDITRHTRTHEFTADDFEMMLATEPLLLALDGLDEIPNVQDRDEVTTEIARARDRLNALAANLVVLVSTRPGSSLSALTASGTFTVLQVLPLTPGLRRQYLNRWIEVNALEPDSAERLATAFHDNEHLPHIQELASSPMQLAILLNLLHRRQLLPEQRTELFRNYLESSLDREQAENKEPLLAQHRNVLVDTHAYLGWYLHSQTELGALEGGIGQDELRRVLRVRLEGQPDAQKLADAIYSAITSRVLCLVEREGKFEFEVQSLREYFAAWHLFENLTSRGVGDSRDDGATALLSRAYWTNVTRFFVGMFTKGEVRSLHDNFRSADNAVSPHPLVRATAALTLADRVYQAQSSTVLEKVVAFVLDGSGVTLGELGLLDSTRIPLQFSDRAGRAEAVAYLRQRLENGNGPVRSVASSLYRHATVDDDLVAWWWEQYRPSSSWVEVAATLQALGSLDPDETARLVAALEVAADEEVAFAHLLLAGGYDGDDDRILQLVLREQNRGVVAEAAQATPVALLSQFAAAIVTKNRAGLPRARRNEQDPLGAARAAHLFLGKKTSDGVESLVSIAGVWGEGWVLGRAVASLPSATDLAIVTSNPHLNSALRTEHSFRTHSDDAQWWQDALRTAATDTERDLRVVGLLSHARQDVLIESIAHLELSVGAMSPAQYSTVCDALVAGHGISRGRRLPLDEAVRVGTIRATGRVLWLIRVVSTEPTGWIDKQLEKALEDVAEAGIEPSELFAAVHPRRTVGIDIVRGATLEELPPTVKLGALTASRVAEVMSAPELWPVQIVESAINTLAAKKGTQLPPLTQVAQENTWDVG